MGQRYLREHGLPYSKSIANVMIAPIVKPDAARWPIGARQIVREGFKALPSE